MAADLCYLETVQDIFSDIDDLTATLGIITCRNTLHLANYSSSCRNTTSYCQ